MRLAMKWIVLQRGEAGMPPGAWRQLGTTETPDDRDRMTQESQAVRQVAVDSGVYAVVPFDEWSLHEAETRVVSHPLPKRIDPGEPEPEAEPEQDAAPPELHDDEDMAGLVQGPRRS